MKQVFKCRYCGKPGHLKCDCCIRIADERREKASDSRPREKANQVLITMEMCYLQVMNSLFKQLVVGSSILVQALPCARIKSYLQ